MYIVSTFNIGIATTYSYYIPFVLRTYVVHSNSACLTSALHDVEHPSTYLLPNLIMVKFILGILQLLSLNMLLHEADRRTYFYRAPRQEHMMQSASCPIAE